MALTRAQERELGEIVLRTRQWTFRHALPAITETVRRIVAESDDERHRGANKMISDYRRLIAEAVGRKTNS